MNPLTPEFEQIIERMVKDQNFRLAMVRKSFFWFFHYYFQKYVKYQTADFQREIFQLLENQSYQNIVITAFRGSGKSTIVTLAYAIWCILGEQERKYVLILGNTQVKAQILLLAIKHEFEHNELLRADLGPFKEENNQWGAIALILAQYGAKISISSVEQSVRGARHYEHRPDVIICDDLEDMDSVRTQESRDKIFEWLTSDVLPAGDKHTRLIFIGTPLHEDSLLKRLEKLFTSGNPKNVFRRYPIIDEEGKPLWPGKFPTDKEIQAEREKCLNDRAWQREYLLRIVQSETQIIKREDIHFYTELPKTGHRRTILMIDPAHSQRAGADCTAMVALHMYGNGKDRCIYVSHYTVNAQLTTDQLIAKVKQLTQLLTTSGYNCHVYVEDVGVQGVFTDLLVREGIYAKGYKPRGETKISRVETVAPWAELGKVRFALKGNESLIQQILGFGIEKHDDLVDAFTMGCIQLIKDTNHHFSITHIYMDGGRPNNNDWMTSNRGWTRLN